MKVPAAVVSILLVGVSARAGEIRPTATWTVKICTETGPAAPFVLLQAEVTASRIFAAIGVAIDWRHAVRFCGSSSDGTILMHLSTGVSPARHPGALAYAELSGARRVEVFYDRVVATAQPQGLPAVLGHVLAHEAAHILEDVNRHSAQGIMKAHWFETDFLDMVWKPLTFMPEDVELIHRGIDAGASRLASRK